LHLAIPAFLRSGEATSLEFLALLVGFGACGLVWQMYKAAAHVYIVLRLAYSSLGAVVAIFWGVAAGYHTGAGAFAFGLLGFAALAIATILTYVLHVDLT
jgi:hypothetical protein